LGRFCFWRLSLCTATVQQRALILFLGIECSKSRRPATIEWVERMIEKHRDLTDNKLVLVSGSGFTPTALHKAELELFTHEGLQMGSLHEIADSSYRADSIVEYILHTFIEPGDYLFGLDYTPPSGSYIIDKAGTRHTVELLRIAVSVHLDERIPVDLRHAVFKDSQVAYGSLQVEDLQGLLTIGEAPGRPMSADLRLSPSTKKKR